MEKIRTVHKLVESRGCFGAAKALSGRVLRNATLWGDRQMTLNGLRTNKDKNVDTLWIKMKFGIAENIEPKVWESYFEAYERDVIVSAADEICNFRFSILGSNTVRFESGIPWNTDIISGYSWPMDYYRDVEADIGSEGYFERNCDIKVPWELSRMQYLVTLGQAYRMTGDNRYCDVFKMMVSDWVEKNPYKQGPNWACAMDVAIRGVSWSIAAVLFRAPIQEDPTFSTILWNNLRRAAVFVSENLECDIYGHGNNHYLSNLAGLLFMGLALKDSCSEAERWISKAIAGLESEIIWQVNEDGGGFEASLSYHRLSTEIFLMCAVAADQNGCSLSSSYLATLERMCSFISDYLKPNGTAPVLGDADDGRFVVLSGFGVGDVRDHRHLLGAAGVFFKRNDLILAAETSVLDMKWLFADIPIVRSATPKEPLVVYKQSGIVRFAQDDIYMMIKCGPLGLYGKGTHDHNDQLSFELNIWGLDIVVDSGSVTYTGNRSLRQAYRSVSAHNVTQCGDYEQNTIRNRTLKDLFVMYSQNFGEIQSLEKTDEGFSFKGRMRQENSGVTLVRDLKVNSHTRRIDFMDTLDCSHNGASGISRLHLSKEVISVELDKTSALLMTQRGTIRLETSGALSMERCDISESYGVTYESVCLSWRCGVSSTFSFLY